MRRDSYTSSPGPGPTSNLIFHAPLISNYNDVTGNRTPSVSGTVTYNPNGAYFSNNSLLTYSFPVSDAITAKSFYCEVMPVSQVNTYDYVFLFGNYTNNTPYFRVSLCRQQSGGYIYITVSKSSNRYDYDVTTSTIFSLQNYLKFAFVLDATSQKLYCNGNIIWSNSASDTWSGWGSSNIILRIGGTGNSSRCFNGYVKNFRIYNTSLTQNEIYEIMGESSYVDWLRSLGCIAYMPLRQGDMMEYIWGNTASTTGYGSMTWNSTYNMYQFTSPTTYPYGVLTVPINVTKQTNSFTVLMKIKSGSKNAGAIGLLQNNVMKFWGGSDAKNTSSAPTAVQTNWSNTSSPFYNVIIYNINNTNSNQFVYNYENYYSNIYDYLGDYYTMGTGQQLDTLNIAQSFSSAESGSYSNYNGASYYLSDIMCFDTDLDLQTIRKIQEYDNYISWLKSKGCVFYCAFDNTYGTIDLINNTPFTVSGNGSYSYNSTENMYSLTSPSSQGQDIGYWNNGITNTGTFANNCFSALYTIKKITSNSSKSIFGVAPNSNNFRTCQALGALYNSTESTSSWPSDVVYAASSYNYDEGLRRYYQNGALYTETSLFEQYTPSNWVTLGSGLRLGRTPVDSNTSFQSVSEYMKEVYIFNKALDLPTIRKIQGYAEYALPKEYVQLEYLESNGTQYIDTGYKPNNNTYFLLDFQPTKTDMGGNDFSGVRWTGASTYDTFSITDAASANYNIYNYFGRYSLNQYGAIGPNSQEFLSQRHVGCIDGINKRCLLDNTYTLSIGDYTYQSTYNLYLFAHNNMGTITEGYVKIFESIIKENNETKRHFIPAMRLADSKPGLYDMISGNFYTNQGTGEFTYGGIVLPEGYTTLAYIEGTGTQYINTGVNNSSGSQRIVLDTSWVDYTSYQAMGIGTSNELVVRVGNISDSNLGLFYTAQSSGTWSNNACGVNSGSSMHRFDIQSGSQKFDGTQISANSIDGWNRDFYLFAFNSSWSAVSAFCKCRIHSCLIYENNELIRNFVPALRNSDSKPGLYDLVNNTFYTNQGTGEFVYGYVVPEPYVYCPFTQNANDIKGHLTWTTNNVSTYSATDGARFGGSNYLRSYNNFSFQNFKTMSYLIKFDSIPTDGDSSTWQTGHAILGNGSDQYRYYSFLQHYSAENAELTNCAMAASFSIDNNVLSTPYGSTQTNTWYRITLRVNSSSNNVSVFIGPYTRNISAMIPTTYSWDMRLGVSHTSTRYLTGYIKDLKIWDVELTDYQIALL